MIEKDFSVSISDNYNNKVNFIGSTNYVPVKFQRNAAKTLSAETRETYLGKSETLTIQISYLNQNQFNILEDIFYSSGKKTITTEKGQIFKMIFNTDSLILSDDRDADTYEIFYYGTIEMVS